MDGKERRVNCIGRSEVRTHLLPTPAKGRRPRSSEGIKVAPCARSRKRGDCAVEAVLS